MNLVLAFSPNIVSSFQSKILVVIGLALMGLGVVIFIIGLIRFRNEESRMVKKLRRLEVNAKLVDGTKLLNELRLKLGNGLSEYDVAISDRPTLAELSIQGIVYKEQRRTASGPHQYDLGYWKMTEFGNRIMQHLDRHQLSSHKEGIGLE